MKNQRNDNKPWLFIVLLLIFVATFTVIAAFYVKSINNKDNIQEEIAVSNEEPETVNDLEEEKPQKIDFQPIVDEWVSDVNGNKSVIVYDLDLDELVGVYNPDETYNTASLYKLFVVYEGYKRLENGEWQADSPAGHTGYSILECLDLAIRESNSSCAETLWSMIGRDNMDKIVKNDFKIMDTSISDLSSNPNDILKMMQIFYQHEDIIDEKLVETMKDSFLNQPKTEYDWRQGLPRGFLRANVYNKVGWDYNPNGYWNIYHDAAIVEFPEQARHYIVIVMSNRVDFKDISKFGSMIEDEFYLRG